MGDQNNTVRITFEGLSRAEASQAANELREQLLNRVSDELVARIEKEDLASQDVGSTLVLLFGTSAALNIAQGIRLYLSKRGTRGTRVIVETSSEKMIVEDLDPRWDPAPLVAAMTKKRR
jgi:hypothetical protein